jgi:hypothetical protein
MSSNRFVTTRQEESKGMQKQRLRDTWLIRKHEAGMLALIYVGASAVAAVLSYLLIVGPIRRLDFAYLDTTTSDTKGTATEQPA